MNTQTETGRRFFIKTLGCKVNQYESQAMREILINSGFKECLVEEIADVYIVNTCTVTQAADRESRYSIGFFHRMNPSARIVVTGCYVEKDADEVSSLPGISAIIKNSDKSRIAEFLSERRNIQYAIPNTISSAHLTITDFKGHTKAFVKIQDGCENFCSYCKVPLVRGDLKSKLLTDVVKEVRLLIDNGFKEVVLAGICLGAWGKDISRAAGDIGKFGSGDIGLVNVLRALENVRGDFRIRLSSIEPKYVTDDLINFIANSGRVCKHLHIPLQSGDDEILKKMNRPYTVSGYKSLIDKLRAKIEDVSLTTDLLVGFPGESEKNFANTLECVKYILPAKTHIFTFSKRKGTAAYEMAPPAARDILKRRYYKLKVASFGSSYIYRTRFLKKTLDVLVETRRDKDSGLLTGYSDNYIKVLFEGPDDFMKEIIPVMIEGLTLEYTFGRYEPRTFSGGKRSEDGAG